MKVLKFGGTSMGTSQPLLNVKSIVGARTGCEVVVVSALGGMTDELIRTSGLAEAGDPAWKDHFFGIRKRHFDLVGELFGEEKKGKCLSDGISAALDELGLLYESVFTLKVLPSKTYSEIVSFGERLSSMIAATLIEGAVLYDARTFIKTVRRGGKDVLDSPATETLVKEAFRDFSSGVAVVPGFISSDSVTGTATTLGRGGSDYTASILAAYLGAESLEIWTDVDGFMTADPRIIKTSYVIDELSFTEAMELCNFGAKVIYPPALYPTRDRNIPIYIKNTFNPSARGTLIRHDGHTSAGKRPVTGISSIDNTCIITVSGPSMAGIIGIDGRIFSVLARENISVFLVCQSASETGISIGVKEDVADIAVAAISGEFSHEISDGAMAPVELHRGLATVAMVGENMKANAGIAGKLFSVLGRNGISIIACAQGTEERNISFVVEKNYLKKSLNVIHDSFLLSEYQELNLFICGVGTVGSNLIEQIAGQREKLMAGRNLKLNVVGIMRSSRGLFNRDGIDLSTYREDLACAPELNLDKLRDEVIGMNIFNSVFVDCTASEAVAGLYKDFFSHGISVVAANKVAASSGYANYSSLKALARSRGVKFLFETNVGAGLPIINTINALCNSGDKILKIEAVVSGTLNFIFNTISEDIPFSKTVRMAKEQGYSEPDPRVDLSGKDVIRKLVILARESGYRLEQGDVVADRLIPADFFDCSVEEFWRRLPSLDAGFEERRKRLVSENKRWRFVASMDGGRYGVSLREIPLNHPFYELEGSNNIVLLTTERYHDHPMLIQGYGAGAAVTAAGVFADIMSIANV